MTDRRAIIDIGSNTVRLVVYDGPRRAPSVVLNEKVTARLGREVARTGMLSGKSMQVALASLRRYAAMLRLMGVDDVQTVATAATRDAANGPAFLAEIAQLGLSPRLLSGEEEARTSAMGVIAAFPGAQGVAGDLGGGSLELTHIAGEKCCGAISLPLGTLRLGDMRRDGDAAFLRQVRKLLRTAGWKQGRNEPFYIVGGSWRALALYAMAEMDWPLDDPHDLELSPQEAARICDLIVTGGTMRAVPRISASRMENLPGAAALLNALVQVLKPSRVVFSSWGLREGLLYLSLEEAARQQDPVLACVTDFVKRHDVDAQMAANIADWIGDAIPGSEAMSRTLRLCATMLALAVASQEPNLRAGEGLGWALRKRWIGLDARGRALIAAAVLASTGNTQVPEQIAPFASPTEFEGAVGWGLAVRLARKLTNGVPAALAGSGLSREGDLLILTLGDAATCLYTASIAKNFTRLAERLSLKTMLRDAIPAQAGAPTG